MKTNLVSIFLSFLCLCVHALNSTAQASPHLKCLGRAEANIHKFKIGGAYKQVNQLLIGELVQMNDNIKLEKQLLEKVCHKSTLFPSLTLLECLITKKEKCFTNAPGKLAASQIAVNKGSIMEIVKHAPDIFIRFVNSLQGQLTVPNCLIKKIPQLENFYYKTRYTLGDINMDQLIKEIKNIPRVFKTLQSPKVFNECQRPAEQ